MPAPAALLAAALVVTSATPLWAPEVRLSIQKGFGEKLIVAVPLFEGDGAGLAGEDDIRDVLSFDLNNSGYFKTVENVEFVDEAEADDRRSGTIDFPEWLALGAEVLVKGEFSAGPTDFAVEATVYDLAQGQPIFGRRYIGVPAQWRGAVHRLVDDIVQRLTGERGIATSKIAFVSNATGTKEIYVMDYDGENRKRITKDNTIAVYPAWFPDGSELVFCRAPAKDAWFEGMSDPKFANDPEELPIKYDLYRIPFNEGKGGTAVPVEGASHNGMSNTFAKVSPDGKWIVFTKCRNGLLMRPDSRLWIAK